MRLEWTTEDYLVQPPCFYELHKMPGCPLLWPVEISTTEIESTTNRRINHSSQFIWLADLLGVHSVPSPRSLMMKLNSTEPCIDLWNPPLVTLYATHCEPLYLRAIQFSAELIVHLSRPHFISLSMRMLWEAVLKAFTKSRSTTINHSHHPRRPSSCSGMISANYC